MVNTGEEFSHILFTNTNGYHDHLYLTVDGRSFELSIILDEQSMFYTILQKVILSFLFTLQSQLLPKQLYVIHFSFMQRKSKL